MGRPRKSLTKLEEEKQSKKLASEFSEELDATGQDSESEAAKWVLEKGNEAFKEQKSQEGRILELLDKKKNNKILDYWRTVAQTLVFLAREEEFPQEWYWTVAITEKGVVMYMESPDKRRFVRAIKPSFVVEYDLQAIFRILESMWTKVNELKEIGESDDFFAADGRKYLPKTVN